MNHLDAIAEVLKSVNAPMSCKDLADEVIRWGLITEYGKTLHASFWPARGRVRGIIDFK